MRIQKFGLVFVLFGCGLPGCIGTAARHSHGPDASQGKGRLIGVKDGGTYLVIEQKAPEGSPRVEVVEYRLKESAMLEGIRAGDYLRFMFDVVDSEATLLELEKSYDPGPAAAPKGGGLGGGGHAGH